MLHASLRVIINDGLSASFSNWDWRGGGGGVLLYHPLLYITLFLSVCRSKAYGNGVAKMYFVAMTGRQSREKSWSIRHVSRQKGEGGEG